jgi:hypothetical protein
VACFPCFFDEFRQKRLPVAYVIQHTG